MLSHGGASRVVRVRTASFCLREGQIQAIDDISRHSQVTEDVPDLSKSEVARKLLDAALDDEPDVMDLVTESTVVQLREERYMTDEGDLVNKRTGFETQVKRHFKTRFENGYRPAQLEDFAANMRAKARAYWPEDVGDDYGERRSEALAYIDALLEEAKAAADASDYDPLDPSEVFDGYAGVENGRSREGFEDVVTDARGRLDGAGTADATGATDEDALVRALSNQHDVSEELAREALNAAKDGGSE